MWPQQRFSEYPHKEQVKEVVAKSYGVRVQDVDWTLEIVTIAQFTLGTVQAKCAHGYKQDLPMEMKSMVPLNPTHNASSERAGVMCKVLTGQCPDCGRVIVAMSEPQSTR